MSVLTGRRGGRLALGLLLPLLAGCATYSAKFADLKPELASGQFDAALATVEKESGSKDRLLYYLERGLILHYADRYAESNEAFAAALLHDVGKLALSRHLDPTAQEHMRRACLEQGLSNEEA